MSRRDTRLSGDSMRILHIPTATEYFLLGDIPRHHERHRRLIQVNVVTGLCSYAHWSLERSNIGDSSILDSLNIDSGTHSVLYAPHCEFLIPSGF